MRLTKTQKKINRKVNYQKNKLIPKVNFARKIWEIWLEIEKYVNRKHGRTF